MQEPRIERRIPDTHIQKQPIDHDNGIYGVPDDAYDAYNAHGTRVRGVMRLTIGPTLQKWMNGNVARIQRGAW